MLAAVKSESSTRRVLPQMAKTQTPGRARPLTTRRISADGLELGSHITRPAAHRPMAHLLDDPVTYSRIQTAYVLADCGHTLDGTTVPELLDVPTAQRNCPMCATPIIAPPKPNFLAQSFLQPWLPCNAPAPPMPEWSKDAASLRRWLESAASRRRAKALESFVAQLPLWAAARGLGQEPNEDRGLVPAPVRPVAAYLIVAAWVAVQASSVSHAWQGVCIRYILGAAAGGLMHSSARGGAYIGVVGAVATLLSPAHVYFSATHQTDTAMHIAGAQLFNMGAITAFTYINVHEARRLNAEARAHFDEAP